jgi:heme-degrading monooxygenase HmoA
MGYIADTPDPPYTAVVFTAVAGSDPAGYLDTAMRMLEMAQQQPGFLGVESSAGPPEITVSYWATDEHARAWKAVAEHLDAQRRGQEQWYTDYRVRVCRVERDYGPPG